MKPSFFGQYLLHNGFIDAQQLIKAVNLQEKNNLPLGEIAIAEGLLDTKQLTQILFHQKSEDLSFGKAAEKLGFLTKSQVDELIVKQKENHLYLGDALVRLGVMTAEQKEHYLQEYEREFNQKKSVSDDLSDKEYPGLLYSIETFTDLTIKILSRMGGILAKYVTCEIKEHKISLLSCVIQISFYEMSISKLSQYIFMTPQEIARSIAEKMFNDYNITCEESMVDSALLELVNVICGQACSMLPDREILKFGVPERKMTASNSNLYEVLEPNQKAAVVDLVTPFGDIKFSLIFHT